MLRFDSDYMEGAHPKILEALTKTNFEQTAGYGFDPYTKKAADKIRAACNAPQAEVFFMVGGTQTNATIIDGLLQCHEGVICADSGHISVHEAGAIEATGHKVLTLPQVDGKIQAEQVKEYIDSFYADETHIHMVAPGMVYISHPTEYGTLYTLDELTALSNVCHDAGIPLYVDGARMGYAMGSKTTDVSLSDIARLVDVFYIGGTKVGALFGEAVVICNTMLLKHLYSLIKQHGALLAKGRLLGIQFDTLFTDGLYEKMGTHGVNMALKLKEAFTSKGYELFINSPTNQQFLLLPNELIDRLRKDVSFEMWGVRGKTHSVVRFVTSWATKPEDIDALAALL